MKWSETTASECRYGECAKEIFGDCEILWEDSEADYQGHAEVLAQKADGTFLHYRWDYGSCSGCDEWEDRGLSHDETVEEMRRHTANLSSIESLKRYFGVPTGGSNDEYKQYLQIRSQLRDATYFNHKDRNVSVDRDTIELLKDFAVLTDHIGLDGADQFFEVAEKEDPPKHEVFGLINNTFLRERNDVCTVIQELETR